eukprot:6527035-Prymnesium_polylepis.2
MASTPSRRDVAEARNKDGRPRVPAGCYGPRLRDDHTTRSLNLPDIPDVDGSEERQRKASNRKAKQAANRTLQRERPQHSNGSSMLSLPKP